MEDTKVLYLNWIPVSKKNRSSAVLIPKKGWRLPMGKARKGWQPNARILFRTDPKVEEHTKAVQAIVATSSPVTEEEAELVIYIDVFRKTPGEEKTGKRNSRRGDLVNVPGLICDALEGLWYKNDEQITECVLKEYRCCGLDGMQVQCLRRKLD